MVKVRHHPCGPTRRVPPPCTPFEVVIPGGAAALSPTVLSYGALSARGAASRTPP